MNGKANFPYPKDDPRAVENNEALQRSIDKCRLLAEATGKGDTDCFLREPLNKWHW